MPALRFSHVGIFAVDPHSLAAFYEDVLAFTRTDSGELPGPDGKLVKLVFLSRDPEEVYMEGVLIISLSESVAVLNLKHSPPRHKKTHRGG